MFCSQIGYLIVKEGKKKWGKRGWVFFAYIKHAAKALGLWLHQTWGNTSKIGIPNHSLSNLLSFISNVILGRKIIFWKRHHTISHFKSTHIWPQRKKILALKNTEKWHRVVQNNGYNFINGNWSKGVKKWVDVLIWPVWENNTQLNRSSSNPTCN